MPLEKPHFQSKLPDFLTQDISPKEKYILESLSVMTQTNDWLVDETVRQSTKLETLDGKVTQVDNRLQFTNGKIANAILQIKALENKNEAEKEKDEQLTELVSFKKFVQKYLFNRYAVGTIVIIIMGIIKISTNPELREFLFRVIGF
jgi:hypothetical protein